MERLEPEREAQIWQRVRSGQQVNRETSDLRQLLMAAGDRAAIYRGLTREHPARERLKKLYEGELADMACLRGMCVLSGETVRQQPIQPGKEGGKKALEQCYHRSCRAASEYMARIADPEFGAVFSGLAKRQEERCAVILEILGGK